MRLSNWCILFMSLFLAAILLPDIRENYYRQAVFTTELYNRNVDRATEDALLHCEKEEYVDGSVRIEETEVKDTFYQQIYRQLDVGTDAGKKELRESVHLSVLINEKSELSLEEARNLRESMEETVNKESEVSRINYCLLFPEQEADGWSQPLTNKSFYHFVELADQVNYPWSNLLTDKAVRFFLSGAKFRKSNAQ